MVRDARKCPPIRTERKQTIGTEWQRQPHIAEAKLSYSSTRTRPLLSSRTPVANFPSLTNLKKDMSTIEGVRSHFVLPAPSLHRFRPFRANQYVRTVNLVESAVTCGLVGELL